MTTTTAHRTMVSLPAVAGSNDETYQSTTTTTATATATQSPAASATTTTVYPLEMSEQERYLFDLQGYLVVRNVLTASEVAAANAAIDRRLDQVVVRTAGPLRNAPGPSSPFYGTGPGRRDLGRVLEWNRPDSTVFASILAHPRLVPLFHGLLGQGYHMDHLPLCIMQGQGAEGFSLHGGTIDCVSGEYNPHLAYTCQYGTIRSSLLGCNVILEDHNPGDGGFCIVPGSHKSHFKMPPGFVDGYTTTTTTTSGTEDGITTTTTALLNDVIVQPATKAGDVILFSEGTVHGALPWTPANRERRVCLYRFAPATNVYGRSYFGHDASNAADDEDTAAASTTTNTTMGWPRGMYEGLTDAQRAVLEPPYANRLDRPVIQPDGSVSRTTRHERKKQHDRDVFGTPYF